MRTEKEMMSLIMNASERENRIRAVILNGSRANDFVTKDRYQDYDIEYPYDDDKRMTEYLIEISKLA